MAKKAKKKEEKEKKVKPNFSHAEKLFLDNTAAIKTLKEVVVNLEQRIDNIINAHEKCKSLKGI